MTVMAGQSKVNHIMNHKQKRHKCPLQFRSIARVDIRRNDDINHAARVLYGQKCQTFCSRGMLPPRHRTARMHWVHDTLCRPSGMTADGSEQQSISINRGEVRRKQRGACGLAPANTDSDMPYS